MNDSSPSLSAYADPTVMRHVLTTSHSIAVVGLSPRPDRPSHQVAIYLKAHGYRVIPVNPVGDGIRCERCFPDRRAIGEIKNVVADGDERAAFLRVWPHRRLPDRLGS